MALGNGDELNDLADDLVGADALGIGFVAQNNTVTQGIMDDSPDVVWSDMVAAIKPGMDSGAFVQRKAATRAGPDFQMFFQVLAVLVRVSCG